MEELSKNYFSKAKDQLKLANEELLRPQNDVVTYLVCKNAQNAILGYLKGYLTQHGFETDENETMQSLLDRCKMLDSKFNNVDLQTINCKSHAIDSKYCNDVAKVNSCYNAASELDTFFNKL